VTGFLGSNGSGKSTTMRMIMGLDAPTSGTALIGGVPYRSLATPSRTVGAVLEARSFHPGRSARAHLLALAAGGGIPRRRVAEVLSLVGLSGVATRRAGTFSLGMGQRLGIAAALLGDPEVLLLDEPVNGLDPEGVRWIRACCDRRRRPVSSGTDRGELARGGQAGGRVQLVAMGRVRHRRRLPGGAAGGRLLTACPPGRLSSPGTPGAAGTPEAAGARQARSSSSASEPGFAGVGTGPADMTPGQFGWGRVDGPGLTTLVRHRYRDALHDQRRRGICRRQAQV
jgi:ABC-type transport system involved in cytochrome c biogenesis ATPase subunit